MHDGRREARCRGQAGEGGEALGMTRGFIRQLDVERFEARTEEFGARQAHKLPEKVPNAIQNFPHWHARKAALMLMLMLIFQASIPVRSF